MIKVIVPGACGRMGKRIINIINEAKGIVLSGATESPSSPCLGKDAGEIAGLGKNGVIINSEIDKVIDNSDVIIDFTTPDSTISNLEKAVKSKKAIVIGTTGFSTEQIDLIKSASKHIGIVFAPNMSVGVNVMLKILSNTAKILGDDFDVEIVETHHRLKKDAPSGTALKIAEVLSNALNRDLNEVGVYSRKGIIGERTQKEIGIQTIRAGDVVGDHTVIFGGLGERIEITHKASSRDTFSRGAVRAAQWLSGKSVGLYDMHDVLGLK